MDEAVATLYAEIEKLGSDEEYREAAFVGKPEGNPVTLGPRVKDATKWVDDMVTGATNRSARWLENTLSPKKDPKKAALKAKEKYANNMRKSLEEGSWEKAVEGYDEGAREAVIKEGGTSAFTEGIRRHKPKAVAKINKLQPLIVAVATAADKDPVGTDAERETKMINNLRRMKEVGKIMKGVKTGTPTI